MRFELKFVHCILHIWKSVRHNLKCAERERERHCTLYSNAMEWMQPAGDKDRKMEFWARPIKYTILFCAHNQNHLMWIVLILFFPSGIFAHSFTHSLFGYFSHQFVYFVSKFKRFYILFMNCVIFMQWNFIKIAIFVVCSRLSLSVSQQGQLKRIACI